MLRIPVILDTVKTAPVGGDMPFIQSMSLLSLAEEIEMEKGKEYSAAALEKEAVFFIDAQSGRNLNLVPFN